MKIKIDKKTNDRIRKGIRVFKKILQDAKERDVNESDTVTIITDMLVDIFGYDRYKEITREYAIRGTYCDLAVKINNKPLILIEVKAIGINLKKEHIRQATDYGAKEGVPWVVLTNGVVWKVFHIGIKHSIKVDFVLEFDFLDDTPKNEMEGFYSLCREGIKKSAIDKIYEYQSFVNKYCIASLIFSDSIYKIIAKKIKSLSKGAKVSIEDIEEILKDEIIKREIVENEDFLSYLKKSKRLEKPKK